MSKKDQNKLRFDSSTPVSDEANNNGKDHYQVLIGDNSVPEPNLSQSQHQLSQSQKHMRSFNSSTASSSSSSSSDSEFRHSYEKPYQDYTSSPHHVLLIIFVAIYILLVLLGASVFALFEQQAEFAVRDHVLRVQHNFLTSNPSVDPEALDSFLKEVLEAYDKGVNLHLLNKIIKMKRAKNRAQTEANQVGAAHSITTSTPSPTPSQKVVKDEKRSLDKVTWMPKSKARARENNPNSKASPKHDNTPTFNPETPTEFSNWEFTSSLMFVTSVVTTIGYGHITPITVSGKVFCIAFSCVSIPFTLICLSIFVSLLKNGPVKKCEKCLIRKVSKYWRTAPVFFIRILHVLIVTVLLLVLILILPSITFCYIEGWTFLEALYYCYISLTTVGLGDFVAATNHLLYSSYLQFYRIYIVFYLYAGLGLIMLWIAVMLRIPQLNWKPFLLTEKEDIDDESTPIVNYDQESCRQSYGTQFYPQK